MSEIDATIAESFVSRARAREAKQRTGSFYTPDWIARGMIERACEGLSDEQVAAPWRMIDPACGDGAFVLPMLDWLARRFGCSDHDKETRLELVERHVFGVDADQTAIDVLRKRVLEWIGFDSVTDSRLIRVLEANFCCGDALLGHDWSEVESLDVTEPSPSETPSGPSDEYREVIDWRSTFSRVALDGGFDLVIGNPPYRRERQTKASFEHIALSPLGRRWKQPRMDLWHYFLHRGLNLLKPLGRLSFIVNSYWTGAVSARPILKRLSEETEMEEIVRFGATRLFSGVTGRHMIFRARKVDGARTGSDSSVSCRIIDLSNIAASQLPVRFRDILTGTPEPAGSPNSDLQSQQVSQVDLWRDHGVKLRSTVTIQGSSHECLPSDGPCLGDLFEVRQGIAENPPFVTKKMAESLGDLSLAGRGVFALADDEIAKLRLNEFERSLLKPYYALSALGRFHRASKPSHHLLYLTKTTAPRDEEIPNVIAHLSQYRVTLEDRREVVSGTIRWWHLHWPREERLFTAPRVVCIQMAHVPSFLFSDVPTFVGFSTHVIVDRSIMSSTRADQITANRPTLPSLCGLLNSASARAWFEANAKHRGANLDISGLVLKRFPLPKRWNHEIGYELDRLVQEAMSSNQQTTFGGRSKRADSTEHADLEERLNQLVQASYRS